MKMTKILILMFAIVASGQLIASNLSPAKSDGIIGEQANGYIGFVTTASTEIKTLVADVNKKRKLRYQQIARSKNLPLSDIEKIGGQQAITKTKSGNYIMRAGEGWTKK